MYFLLFLYCFSLSAASKNLLTTKHLENNNIISLEKIPEKNITSTPLSADESMIETTGKVLSNRIDVHRPPLLDMSKIIIKEGENKRGNSTENNFLNAKDTMLKEEIKNNFDVVLENATTILKTVPPVTGLATNILLEIKNNISTRTLCLKEIKKWNEILRAQEAIEKCFFNAYNYFIREQKKEIALNFLQKSATAAIACDICWEKLKCSLDEINGLSTPLKRIEKHKPSYLSPEFKDILRSESGKEGKECNIIKESTPRALYRQNFVDRVIDSLLRTMRTIHNKDRGDYPLQLAKVLKLSSQQKISTKRSKV